MRWSAFVVQVRTSISIEAQNREQKVKKFESYDSEVRGKDSIVSHSFNFNEELCLGPLESRLRNVKVRV